MATYPPPTIYEPIFNAENFVDPTSSSDGSTGGTGSSASYLQYPSAQGTQQFTYGLTSAESISFTSATGTDREINNVSNIQLIDTDNTTPTSSQTNYTNIYQSGAELYIDNLAPSSVLSITSDSTTFSNDITVNQHLYLSSSVYLKASSSSGEMDLSGTALNLQDSGFAINLPSSSDTLTINSNISCGTITSGNITASQVSNSGTVGSNVQLLSSFPTSNTGTNAGLAVSWNTVGGLGEVDLIGMGQNGTGGFAFYSSSSSNAPQQLLTLYPDSGTYPGATFASGLPVKFNTTPTCPTMASGNSSTSIATTAFVQNAISSVSSSGFTGTIQLATNVLFDPSKTTPQNSIGSGPVYNLYNSLFIYFKTPFDAGKIPTVIATGTYTYDYTGSTGIVFYTNFNGTISIGYVANNGFYCTILTSSGDLPSQKVYFNYYAALA